MDNDRDIFDLLDFDFFKLIEQNPDIIARLEGLAEILQLGSKAKFTHQLVLEEKKIISIEKPDHLGKHETKSAA
jgi:hypothetical protein